jgi:hypothetical protein
VNKVSVHSVLDTCLYDRGSKTSSVKLSHIITLSFNAASIPILRSDRTPTTSGFPNDFVRQGQWLIGIAIIAN